MAGMSGMMGGGSSGGDSGGDKTKASMMGFQVPSMSGIGLEGSKFGSQAMLQAAQGSQGGNYGNQGNAGSDLVSKLADTLNKKKPAPTEEPTKSFDNPLGMSQPDFMNPMGKRKDLNLGNQSKQLDSINWDNLKL